MKNEKLHKGMFDGSFSYEDFEFENLEDSLLNLDEFVNNVKNLQKKNNEAAKINDVTNIFELCYILRYLTSTHADEVNNYVKLLVKEIFTFWLDWKSKDSEHNDPKKFMISTITIPEIIHRIYMYVQYCIKIDKLNKEAKKAREKQEEKDGSVVNTLRKIFEVHNDYFKCCYYIDKLTNVLHYSSTIFYTNCKAGTDSVINNCIAKISKKHSADMSYMLQHLTDDNYDTTIQIVKDTITKDLDRLKDSIAEDKLKQFNVFTEDDFGLIQENNIQENSNENSTDKEDEHVNDITNSLNEISFGLNEISFDKLLDFVADICYYSLDAGNVYTFKFPSVIKYDKKNGITKSNIIHQLENKIKYDKKYKITINSIDKYYKVYDSIIIELEK